jgi:sugar fermentation stimulation protein A
MSQSDNPKRKYPYTLEMVRVGTTWVGVNTARTNALVEEAIRKNSITEYQQVEAIHREVKVSAGSRLDLAVTHQDRVTYIEVKNCSLVEDGCALFPDAVTTRGTKHLQELMTLAAGGKGACIFFLVQRLDADRFAPAQQIDPIYTETLRNAVHRGVSLLVYQAQVSLEGIEVIRQLPFNV